MTRAGTWIGDWLRSWRALGAAATTADGERLAKLLDLDGMLPAPAPELPDLPEPPPSLLPRSEEVAPEPSAEPPRPAPGRPGGRSVRIEPLPDRPPPPATWTVAEPLSPPVGRLPVRELEPLFRRATTRALLGAAAATWREEGGLVVSALVDDLARGRPIRKLPRRSVPTVRVGAALLVSRRVAEPFAADILDLRQQLRRIAGSASVAEWWLGDDLGLRSRQRHGAPWPPSPGTPVLAVTSDAEDLAPLAIELARRSCPLVAIVPGRGVASPMQNLTVIGWDHRSRVGDVVRARRRADRR